MSPDAPKGPVGTRKEVGDAQSSHRHPPHVSENAEGAPLQDDTAAGMVPTLPANASGEDKVSTEEHAQPIDDESMYDRRPSEDKDRPPSSESTP